MHQVPQNCFYNYISDSQLETFIHFLKHIKAVSDLFKHLKFGISLKLFLKYADKIEKT